MQAISSSSNITSNISEFFGSAARTVGSLGGRIISTIFNVLSPVTSRISPLFAPVTSRFNLLPKPAKFAVAVITIGSATALAYRVFSKTKEAKPASSEDSHSEGGSTALPRADGAENTPPPAGDVDGTGAALPPQGQGESPNSSVDSSASA
ncbi:MAG: hypothetical protein ACOYK9_02250 [Chlamydiia bacterium]